MNDTFKKKKDEFKPPEQLQCSLTLNKETSEALMEGWTPFPYNLFVVIWSF